MAASSLKWWPARKTRRPWKTVLPQSQADVASSSYVSGKASTCARAAGKATTPLGAPRTSAAQYWKARWSSRAGEVDPRSPRAADETSFGSNSFDLGGTRGGSLSLHLCELSDEHVTRKGSTLRDLDFKMSFLSHKIRVGTLS